MNHFFKTSYLGLLLSLLVFAMTTQAQNVQIVPSNSSDPTLDISPNINYGSSYNYQGVEAMWDVQFDYSAEDSAGAGGLAGVAYYNGGYWAAQWFNDTLFSFNMTGQVQDTFSISDGMGGTLSGTRAMTVVGNYIYIANNSLTIHKVDPATRTVVRTFPIQAVSGQGARFITFDPSAASGAGGFWIANFGTDIAQVDTSGALLQTIPAATHGMTGMYGAAYDDISAGGPYLWVFDQGSAPSTAVIRQVSLDPLALGQQTGVIRDVVADIGSGNDLSGGLFISNAIVPGKNTLGGLMQGRPGSDRLFGYELDFVAPAIDGSVSSLNYLPAYGSFPERFAPILGINGFVSNNGTQTITSLSVDITVDSNGVNLVTDNSNSFANVPRFGTNQYSLAPAYTVTGQGSYTLTATSNTGGQMDEDPSNDAQSQTFTVGDSVYARDDANATGAIGVGTGGSILSLNYSMPGDGYLKGIEIELNNPRPNDSTYAALIQTVGGVPTGAPIATGPAVLMDGTQTTYYLPFTTSFPITAGSTWAIGVFEAINTAGGSIGLSSSNTAAANSVPGILYFTTDNGGAWNAVAGFPVPFIRPIFASCTIFGVATTSTPDNGTGSGTATATVSNSSGPVAYDWRDAGGSMAGNAATATGLSAGVYMVTVTDANGCTSTETVTVDGNVGIEDLQQAGINSFELFPNPTRGQLTFNVEFAQPEAFEATLYSIQGQVIANKSFEASLGQSESFDLSDQAAGSYMLRIQTDKGSTFKKVVLTK